MKKLAIMIVVTVASLLTTACYDEALESKAAFVADKICKMTVEERAFLRAKVDNMTSPHKIRVECGEDAK